MALPNLLIRFVEIFVGDNDVGACSRLNRNELLDLLLLVELVVSHIPLDLVLTFNIVGERGLRMESSACEREKTLEESMTLAKLPFDHDERELLQHLYVGSDVAYLNLKI